MRREIDDSFFSERGSTMVLEPVGCPVCGGTNVIKHGKSGEGRQRYLCQDQAYCGKAFIREYSDLGRLPQSKERIIDREKSHYGTRTLQQQK